MIYRILVLLCAAALLLGAACPVTAGPSRLPAPDSPDIRRVIQEMRENLPVLMEKNNIPGLAVAIVDDQQVLWAEGFGYTDHRRRAAVTADTPFSIQSMSKSFTATAVMMAVQDGLVDLDTPISEYLPDFRVNSIFEERPEGKITLRHLLSHTAGFMHEAPIGSNFDLPGNHTLDQHFASIQDTWLRFPVGTRYAYSNLGIDLAGYILQARSGKPFPQYMKEKVFEPLGMVNSSCDFAEIRSWKNRAVGSTGGIIPPPVTILLVPSGGVYTSANDLSRYIRFHINLGVLDGRRILKQELAEEMITPPFAPAEGQHYGLGVGVGQANGALRVEHGGGGFGFLSDMAWYPDLKIGFLVLTNSAAHNQQTAVEQTLENRVIIGNLPVYRERAKNARLSFSRPVSAEVAAAQPDPLSDSMLKDLIEERGLPNDAEAIRRRQGYAGVYNSLSQGFPATDGKFWLSDDGTLFMENNPLSEVQPGFFFDPSGDFIDLRPGRVSYRNIPIVKQDPLRGALNWILFAACAGVFLAALFRRPARALIRRIRRGNVPNPGAPLAAPLPAEPVLRFPLWASLLAGAGALTGLLSLALALLEPRLIWAPWPVPFPEMTWFAQAVLRLPYFGLAAGAVTGALLWRLWKTRPAGWSFYALTAAALAAFNLALIF